MTHLSLFSGIGGLDLAAECAGFRTVAFCEFDLYCQKVLMRHWPGVPVYGDVREFDGREFRGVGVVSAGFPCQPHSLAGKRLASDDERDLWGEVVRIVGEARPRFFVGENVPGLFSSERGAFFGRVLNDLAGLGYRVGWGVWRAADVGAVHRRKRVFIVAYSSSLRLEQLSTGESGREEEEGRLSECGSRIAGDSCGFADGEAGPEAGAIGEGREPRPDAGGADWGGIRWLGTGDWRAWDVEPVICRADDGLSYELDKCRLKALGNAVCPQQAFPIFEAMAEVLR